MLLRLEIRNVDFDQTVLFWSIDQEVGEKISDFGYIASISESENGPWIELFPSPIFAYGFIDTITQRGMFDQRLYYRIKAININTGSEFYSEPVCLDVEDDNYISDYISTQQSLMLQRYNGKPALHFARKKFGDRCPDCYDEIYQKSMKPKCKKCFGTTFIGGYYAPIKIYINTNKQTKAIDKSENGVNENGELSGWTSNKSIIEPDDLIVFLKKTSERYLVGPVLPSSINDTIVRQDLSLIRLKQDHPAQLLKEVYDAYTLDEFNVFRREWKSIR